MRVNVYGPGGVGGYIAARLAASPAAEVSVIARGAHLEAIRSSGLRLESPHGDLQVAVTASHDPAEIGPVDLVLLTVKATDVPAAAARLGPMMGPHTAVITLQNGVDSPRQVAEHVGVDAVFPGVAYIFSTVAAPGLIRHTTGPGRIVFGGPPGCHDRAVEIGRMLTAGGVDNEVVDDVAAALWSKFALICATAGGTAPSRLPIDVLREEPVTRQLFRELAEEVVAVGRAAGVEVASDTVDQVLKFIDDIGPGAYSSLLYDLVNGKPMELEALHGAVVRIGREHGVEVPVNRTIHALLAPWARRNSSPGAPSVVDGDTALVMRGSTPA